MKEKFALFEVRCKLAALAVFGGFYVAAMSLPPASGQYPQLLALVSLVLTVIALAMDFGRKSTAQGEIGGVDDTELMVLDPYARRVRRVRFYKAWAIILVATGVGMLGGFAFSALILFTGFALFFGSGEQRLKRLAIGVAMTVVVYLLFGVLMGVPLLEGLL